MQKPQQTTGERARNWDSAYKRSGVQGVSWHQDAPSVSLELIEAIGVDRDAPVIDVGGGASTLVDHLLARDFVDVTVLDVSATALDVGRRRLGEAAPVTWLEDDLLIWHPERRYGLWHDRATLHFLVTPADRDRYLQTLGTAIREDGFVILATFAPDGPATCSGLPVVRYSDADLAQILGDRFDVLETRREEHTTPHGALQPFTWLAGRFRPE